MRRSFVIAYLVLALVGPATDGRADPPPPGTTEEAAAAKPGAAALGPGTIFLTRAAIRAGNDGLVYLSAGRQLTRLDQPVGTCRLKLRVPDGSIAAGTPLTVSSVSSATSPYDDRGISNVTWIFEPNDPAESLLCDTVGSDGPSQGDVEMELGAQIRIEATQTAE